MNEKIKVSILCTTYNHEPYIRDALEGFIKQNINFKFEVLIHDDASTDGTADIIREYIGKYPNIFKAILQEKNQYSKGIKISKTYLWPLIKGEYVALCEGDDYWINQNKLQKQVDFMDENSDCIACIGGAKMIDYSNKMLESFSYPTQQDRYIKTSEAILKGALYPTATYLFRKDFLGVPNMFDKLNLNFGDYTSIINYTLAGNLYSFHDIFSVYRYKTPDSWTDKNYNDLNGKIGFKNNLVRMFDCLNANTDNAYKDITERVIMSHEFEILRLEGDLKGMKSDRYKDLYKASYGFKAKVKRFLLKCFPIIKKVKAKVYND